MAECVKTAGRLAIIHHYLAILESICLTNLLELFCMALNLREHSVTVHRKRQGQYLPGITS
ncbi:MAG: hypothetical protein ACJASJ_000708 [Candidatus Azotimanducaceae bacterium]